jgi:hypothetical protein
MRQKPASFNLDAVMAQLTANQGTGQMDGTSDRRRPAMTPID